jgi:hypothetical protein
MVMSRMPSWGNAVREEREATETAQDGGVDSPGSNIDQLQEKQVA